MRRVGAALPSLLCVSACSVLGGIDGDAYELGQPAAAGGEDGGVGGNGGGGGIGGAGATGGGSSGPRPV